MTPFRRFNAKKPTILRRRVTDCNAREVSVSDETIIAGTAYDPYVFKYDLANSMLEKFIVAKGEETLTLNGKEYKCHWELTRGKKISELPPIEVKTWFCEDVPLDGVVKRILTNNGIDDIDELSSYGRGNK